MSELKDLMLRPSRLTLAVAESLTCGRVQARVGTISGASEFFLGGLTAYSLDQKVRHLHINGATAVAVNSVSGDVAEQMAHGACVLFGSDLGVSTTGYAEPSEEWNVAEPFAWWALAHRQGPGKFALRRGRVQFPKASRTQVQEEAAEAVMTALVEYLRGLRGQR